MAYAEKAVGQRGLIRIDITQESQNAGANQSTVRVLARVRLTSGGPSGDETGNCKRSLTGDISWGQQSYTFRNMYTSWFTVIDHTVTVNHNSDGTKTVGSTFNFGPTITQNLGAGGSVSTSLTLTPIPKLPGTPGKPSITFTDTNAGTLSWTAASENSWDPIKNYRIEYWNNDTPANKLYVTVSRNTLSYLLYLDDNATGYTFRVQAINNTGAGSWSEPRVFSYDNLPSAPRNTQVVYTSTTTGTISWTAPHSMGSSAFQRYEIEVSPVSNFSYGVRKLTSTTTSVLLTGLSPGEKVFARVRAVNAQGAGFWSITHDSTTPSGPSIKIGTSWRPTVAYVYTGGTWKVAVPYIYVKGLWRLASS